MIRLLLVDDSALMRRHLQQLFGAEGDFILEYARNGREAIEQARQFNPQVIILDINMPELDGLTCLSMLMAERPCPVVMFSSLTEQGAIASLEALALGAVDFFAKPGGTISLNIDAVGQVLVAKVRAAAAVKLGRVGLGRHSAAVPAAGSQVTRPASAQPSGREGLLLVGASTGGPRALEELFSRLPADFPWPVVVAQHMPASFTGAFAQRLDRSSGLRIVEANRPMPLEPGTVYIGMGGADVLITKRAGRPYVMVKPEQANYLWHPSVSLLVSSALQHYLPTQVVGVMLTGMGYDGAQEMTELKQRGGRTIAEAQETSVVFGMPAELIRRGGASLVLPGHAIASTLMQWSGYANVVPAEIH